MAADIDTPESIRKWAQTGFPESFRLFSNFSKIDKRMQLHVEGRIVRGQRIEERRIMIVLQVSELETHPRVVYAWAEKDGTVSLGHLETKSNGRYMAEHDDCTEPPVRFGRPYCWVLPAEDETGAERFEALVRYHLRISCKPASGIRARRAAFKEHFPGACRDVAAGIRARAREKGSERGSSDRCTHLKLPSARLQMLQERPTVPKAPSPAPSLLPVPAEPTVPLAMSQIVSREPSSALPVAPSETSDLMDRAFAAFKDTLNVQILAAQAADRDKIEELRAENKLLEQRAVSAEKEREKYKSGVTAAEQRAKKADEEARKAEAEAERHKMQYEQLKKNVLGAVEMQG